MNEKKKRRKKKKKSKYLFNRLESDNQIIHILGCTLHNAAISFGRIKTQLHEWLMLVIQSMRCQAQLMEKVSELAPIMSVIVVSNVAKLTPPQKKRACQPAGANQTL
jgi:hypothetical protein